MRADYISQMLRSPWTIVGNLYNYKHVIRQMIKSDLKGRFAGSIGGLLWHFIQPMVMLVVYLFVFVYIFKLRVGPGAGTSALYIMSGLFPWIIMAEGLNNGTVSVIQNAELIKRTSFPVELLPAKAVIVPLLSFGIAVGLLAGYQVVFNGMFFILLVLPFLICIQILFTFAVALLTAAVSVFFRDVVHLVQILINFWIFLTPILYPATMLPGWAKKVMYMNPLYPIISIYQSLFMHGSVGPWLFPVLAIAWTGGFVLLGTFVFNKLKFEFTDWL